jgi:hypothetical protein
MAYEGLGLADVVSGGCYCGDSQCAVQAPWMEQRELDFRGWTNSHHRHLPTTKISKVKIIAHVE